MKKFKIYQINEKIENARYLLFSNFSFIKKNGYILSLDMYNIVYDGEIDDNATPEDIYSKFQFINCMSSDIIPEGGNRDFVKPQDYNGHSLSISDIILMDGKYWFCDNIGFKELSLPDVKPTIKKGDKFLCKKDYIMDDNTVAFQKGKVYHSEYDMQMTDELGSCLHRMNDEEDFYQYFDRVA